MNYTIGNLAEGYDVDLDELVFYIGERKVERVLLQFPDGLKPFAVAVCDYLSERLDVEVSIWLGSCFGACDLAESDGELVAQFGHSKW